MLKHYADVSEYFKRMREFDYFLRHLINGGACEGPRGFKYYDAMYRAICLGEAQSMDADPGPYYPFVLLAHYFWRRGDVCKACLFLGKAHGRRPLHYSRDEKIAVKLLEAAIREGTEGVRRIKTEDSHWSWASLFKDLLIAELAPRERAAALQRIKSALERVFEVEEVPRHIAKAYNIFQPYLSEMPYIYIHYAATELEKHEPPRRSMRDILKDIFWRVVRPEKEVKPTPGSSPVCTPLTSSRLIR